MSKIDTNKLLISSDFYSVQGEGISSGMPSYFVRLGLCNLTCGMSNKFLNQLVKDKQLEDGEIFIGDLQAIGQATWTCDSVSQWAWRGEDKEFQYLIDRWIEEGIYDDIINGNVHIIWTGGEPTIKGHQQSITKFLNFLMDVQYIKAKDKLPDVLDGDVYDYIDYNVFNEIETNGTIVIEPDLFYNIHQINCSPKLSNSGLSVKQRINPEAIERIMLHENYQFKFVISDETDVEEMFRDFVVPFNIPLKNVVCMPGLDSQADFHERTRFVLEMAKKYKFRGLTRLHISAWDRVLNV